MNNWYATLKPTTVVTVFLLVVVGIGLYNEYGDTSTANGDSTPANETPKTTTGANPNWEEHSLVPTTVESYRNGTYSLTLNNDLRISFIGVDDGDVTWPESGNQPVISIQSDTLERDLGYALNQNDTDDHSPMLDITGIDVESVRDPDVILRASVTINDELTIHGIQLMDGDGDPWLALPDRRMDGDYVEVVELPEPFLNHLKNRLRRIDRSGQTQSYSQQTEVPTFPEPKHGIRADVIHVYDGDTLKARLLDGTEREAVVRIQGMDCPESSQNEKCESSEYREGMSCEEEVRYGKRAKKIARERLSNKRITLVPTTDDGEFERGHYDRWIAYIRLPDGRDYGLTMVNDGYCKDTSRSYPHQRGETYHRLEAPLKPLN